jgi:class 3 adenylate cyclase
MVGDIVNLAARLMVAAGKLDCGLLCDETTYDGAQAKLSFRKLEPIMVKGKSDPIPIFVPKNKDEAELALEAVLSDFENGASVEVMCIASICVHT